MKRNLIYLLVAISSAILYSCSNDEGVDSNSIFDTSEVQRNDFEKWLVKSYTNPYNIRVLYKFEDIEASMSYTLAPATMENSIKMAKIVKHLWLDVYDEAVGAEFTRGNTPRMMQFIGSGAYDSKNSVILGTAEGGMKITLFDLNNLRTDDVNYIKERYFKTIHHEFAHILHQKKFFDPDFQKISLGDYVSGDWYLTANISASLSLGFISGYARKNYNEDFVETYAIYVVYGRDYWNNRVAQAGTEGAAKLEKKLETVKSYMKQSWNIDIEEVHDIIQRRVLEIPLLDFDTL